MPPQPTLRRAQSVRSAPGPRVIRLHRPTVGQCFDIEVTPELAGWTIRIPEIGAVTHARRRAEVELAARECIAAKTGIPIGYVAVVVS